MTFSRTLSRGMLWGLAGAAVLAPAAFAVTDREILDNSCDFVETIRSWIFGITYVLGAIGLVLVAISAFLGRFKFSHLIALGGGLFVVAMADLLIRFVTSGQNATCQGA